MNRFKTPVICTAGFILVGSLFAAYVVGSRVINPLNTTWLSGDPPPGDPAMNQLGWSFFRKEDRLTFPIGWSDAIGFPIGEPIAYMDTIPILAAAVWPFRHVLPESFQYIGPLFLVHCVLQLYFGYRISLQLSGNNKLMGWLGGLFFMTAPSFVERARGHFALTSHWLILAALDVYFRTTHQISKKTMAALCVISFIAGGVNPYIALMVQMIVGATVIKSSLSEKSTPVLIAAAVTLMLSVGAATIALALFGFLRPGSDVGYGGGGYRFYSMNLFSIVDPLSYPSLLLRRQDIPSGQHEGYNYLGLGVLLLLIISVSRAPSVVRSLFAKDKLGIWIVAVGSLVLALSAKAVAGNTVIYEIDLPIAVEKASSAFRASGRLFWPAAYLLLCFAIAASVHAYKRWAPALLAAMLIVQLLDLHGLYRSIRSQYRSTSSDALTDTPEWQAIGRNHRHLVVTPAWQCNPAESPGGLEGFWTFGKLAAGHMMTINSFRAARYSRTQIAFFCEQNPREIARDGLQDDSAYVFAQANLIAGLNIRDHYCRSLDGLFVCSRQPGISGLDKSIADAFPLLRGKIRAGDSTTPANLFGYGWSVYEPWGRWTDGNEASIAVRLGDDVKQPSIDLTLQPFAPHGHAQRVTVLVNRKQITTQTLTATKTVSIPIPDSDSERRSTGVVITLLLPDAVSPKQAGVSGDNRKLGVGLLEISLKGR